MATTRRAAAAVSVLSLSQRTQPRARRFIGMARAIRPRDSAAPVMAESIDRGRLVMLTPEDELLIVRNLKSLTGKQGWRSTADRFEDIEARLLDEQRQRDAPFKPCPNCTQPADCASWSCCHGGGDDGGLMADRIAAKNLEERVGKPPSFCSLCNTQADCGARGCLGKRRLAATCRHGVGPDRPCGECGPMGL